MVLLLTELPGDNLLPNCFVKTPYSGHVVVVRATGGSSRDSTTCTNAKVNMLAEGERDLMGSERRRTSREEKVFRVIAPSATQVLLSFSTGFEDPARITILKTATGIYLFYIQSLVREKEKPTWMNSRREQVVISDFHHRMR